MTTASEVHSSVCPLGAVDRRLEDVHRQWHEAEQAYFDPEGFRVAIQTAIQTLRTVTFILQSNKALIPNFDPWYQAWRDRLGADPLMRWMVDARNRIEKVGDLEAHSRVRAEVIASYLNEGPVIEVPASLFDKPVKLVHDIKQSDLREHIRNTGTLRIERRWVENTLPDHELLDAVAIAYGRISELVHDAHVQMGLPRPVTTDTGTGRKYPVGRDGRLPCMIGHGDTRTLNIALSSGDLLELSNFSIPLNPERCEESKTRYGLKPEDTFDANATDEEQVLHRLFKTARKMTETDGYHVSILFLLRACEPVQIVQIGPESQAEKYLIMRNLAHEVTKAAADAVVMIGEAWRARFDPTKPYMRAADAPEREEWLVATLVRREGLPIQLAAKFEREGKRVTLGERKSRGARTSISLRYTRLGDGRYRTLG